jgi:HEPN domain-containing protein/predicted nucleotidyltransferase
MRTLSRVEFEDGLREFTDRLVSSCHPTAVVMYGSRVWGDPDDDSDLDLLVVRRTKKNWSYDRKEEVFRFLGSLPISRDLFDFVVVTPEELVRRLSMGDPFLGRIVRKGRVLYGQENLPAPERVMTKPQDSRIAREWFDHAKKHLRSSDTLWGAGEDPEIVAEHLQQGLERTLKGYLVHQGWELLKTHNLEELLADAIRFDPSFDRDDFKHTCKMITKFYDTYRYPKEETPPLTRDDIEPHLSIAKDLADSLESKVG